MAKRKDDLMTMGFLPILSESFPQIGDTTALTAKLTAKHRPDHRFTLLSGQLSSFAK